MDNISKINDKINILKNILNIKIEILNQIFNISENQEMFINSLKNENELNSYISISLKEKQNLINELKDLDKKFVKIFESFEGELNKHKDFFSNDIKIMKEKIQKITDLDLKIRLKEEKNKPLFNNMDKIKNKPIKTLKANKNYILDKYSQNMKYK